MAYADELKRGSIEENWLFKMYSSDGYLEFDGSDDYIDCGVTTDSSPIALTRTTDITIAFWVNFPTLGNTETIFRSHDIARNDYIGWGINKESSNKIAFFWADGSGSDSSSRRTMTSQTVLSADTWYFVIIDSTFASASSGTQIYINSTTSSSVGYSGTYTGAPIYENPNVAGLETRCAFGQKLDPTEIWGQFKIKNLAIWSGLSSSALASLWTQSNGEYMSFENVHASDQKAYWNFTSGSPNDLVGSAHGTVHGAEWVTNTDSFIPLAFSDVTYSGTFYHGVVLNKPSIRESIDLVKSTSKSSNISINIPDFNYGGSPISEILLNGGSSGRYINQDVDVHSYVGGQVLKIGAYRLENMSSNGDTITLTMATQRPWDDITFPTKRHSEALIYEPVAYGHFTPSENTGTRYGVHSGLYPVPVVNITNSRIKVITAREYVQADDPYIHYDTGRGYIPLYTGSWDSGRSTSKEYGVNVLSTPSAYNAKGFVVPEVGTNVNGVTMIGDMERAFDTSLGSWDTSTYASQFMDNIGDIAYFQFTTSSIPFVAEVETVRTRMGVTASSLAGDYTDDQYYNVNFYRNGNVLSEDILTNSNAYDGSQPYLISRTSTGADKAFAFETAQAPAVVPTEIIMKLETDSGYGGISFKDHTLKILGVKVELDVQLDSDFDALQDIEYFYCGGNGFPQSWGGGTVPVEEIHDAHRDILIRYCDVSETEPDGWSALNASKDWNIRWWLLDPTSLKKSLQKLQYEGGFIFRFKADSSPQYIHIKDSYASSEVTTLTKYDIDDVNISPSPFSELLTSMDISYQKTPSGDEEYFERIKSMDSSSRGKWGIHGKENISTVELDAYVGTGGNSSNSYALSLIPSTPSSNRNDDFYTYYHSIFGDMKIIISATIVNPKHFILEVGQVLAFDDMHPVKAFNQAWSGLKFMITSTSRSLGTLKFEAREI
jgi:hypothetical protein